MLQQDSQFARQFAIKCCQTNLYFDKSGQRAAKIFPLPEIIDDDRPIVGRDIFQLVNHDGSSIADLTTRPVLNNWILDRDINPYETELAKSGLLFARDALVEIISATGKLAKFKAD